MPLLQSLHQARCICGNRHKNCVCGQENQYRRLAAGLLAVFNRDQLDDSMSVREFIERVRANHLPR